MKLKKEKDKAWKKANDSDFLNFLKKNFPEAGINLDKESFDLGFDKGVSAERSRVKKVMEFLCDQYLGPFDKDHLAKIYGED